MCYESAPLQPGRDEKGSVIVLMTLLQISVFCTSPSSDCLQACRFEDLAIDGIVVVRDEQHRSAQFIQFRSISAPRPLARSDFEL